MQAHSTPLPARSRQGMPHPPAHPPANRWSRPGDGTAVTSATRAAATAPRPAAAAAYKDTLCLDGALNGRVNGRNVRRALEAIRLSSASHDQYCSRLLALAEKVNERREQEAKDTHALYSVLSHDPAARTLTLRETARTAEAPHTVDYYTLGCSCHDAEFVAAPLNEALEEAGLGRVIAVACKHPHICWLKVFGPEPSPEAREIVAAPLLMAGPHVPSRFATAPSRRPVASLASAVSSFDPDFAP